MLNVLSKNASFAITTRYWTRLSKHQKLYTEKYLLNLGTFYQEVLPIIC